MTSIPLQNIAATALQDAEDAGAFGISTATETALTAFPALVVSASTETHQLRRGGIATHVLNATLFLRAPDHSREEIETLVEAADTALAKYWTCDMFCGIARKIGIALTFSGVYQESFDEPRTESETLVFSWRFAVVSQRVDV